MILARVGKEGLEDRLFSIEDGLSTLGSGLDCDIVLLDDEIQQQHLTFRVEANQFALMLMPAANAFLQRHQSKEEPIYLRAQEWVSCGNDDMLGIDGITITFSGIAPVTESAQSASPARRAMSLISLKWMVPILAGLGVACGIILAIGLSSASDSPSSARTAPAPTQASETDPAHLTSDAPGAPVPSQDTALTAASLEKTLASKGISPKDLEESNGLWSFTLYVPDDAAREKVRETLASLNLPLSADIILDSDLATAVETSLTNMQSQAELVSVHSGVVTLKGPEETAEQQKIIATLQGDVSDMAEVVFDHDDAEQIAAIKKQISGLWSGSFPYVLLTGDKIIRPGQPINDSATLIGVEKNALIVDLDGQNKRIEVNDNTTDELHQ
ncbi:FHA domain-containing protein [Martelella sp. HB161492]|uniref:FHA domain-containing protein n=1 Tax=Martelella sp. HB161492 TaxID=2720726 RepID=UPI001591E8FB|nr:FHA domain-containing protein [Martelella sp. HB161492]